MSFINMPSYRLSITTTPARLTIKSKRLGFRIKEQKSKMDVNVQTPQMKADWESYYSQVGLKNAGQLAQANAQLSRQYASMGTSNYVNEGNQMGDIENGGTAGQVIANISVNRMDSRIPEVGAGPMPVDSMEINWSTNSLDVNWSAPQFDLEWDTDFKPDVQYTAASVDIQLETVERLRFDVKPFKPLGSSYGKYVNKDI